MKKYFLFSLLFVVFTSVFGQVKRNCGAMDVMQTLQNKQPELYNNIKQTDDFINNWIEMHPTDFQRQGDTVIIPVVVHVVWKNAVQNIPDQQVFDQIRILNEDFARYNADTVNTPAGFKNRAGGIAIKFALAKRTPDGLPSNGIDRVKTNTSSFSGDEVKYTNQGGADAWNSSQYLNLWCCELAGGLLGYAQFPGGAPSTDGVVILNQSFGITENYPYHLGRTASHEVGHWLGLYHIWGDDGSACSGSDNITDTPNQAGPTYGCPSFPENDNCNNTANGIMFPNYMDYTDDSCYNMFTKKQVEKMNAVLLTDRIDILTSPAMLPGVGHPFDASLLAIISPSGASCALTYSPSALIHNFGDSIINSVKFEIDLDGSLSEYTRNETILSGDTLLMDFPSFNVDDTGTYSYKLTILEINGMADTFTNNNTKASIFKVLGKGGPLPFEDGFEDNFSLQQKGYSIINGGGSYTWENWNTAGFASNECVYLDCYSNSDKGQIDRMILPSFSLVGADVATLTFDHSYQLYRPSYASQTYTDTFTIEISTNCGVSFQEIYRKSGDEFATVPLDSSEWEPISDDEWAHDSIDLTQFVGEDFVVLSFTGINDFGNNMYIDNINVTSATTTGIHNEVLGESRFNVYPNPAKDKFNIHYGAEEAGNISIRILDITGSTLESHNLFANKGNNSFSFDLKELPSGILFITLDNGKVMANRKLVVY